MVVGRGIWGSLGRGLGWDFGGMGTCLRRRLGRGLGKVLGGTCRGASGEAWEGLAVDVHGQRGGKVRFVSRRGRAWGGWEGFKGEDACLEGRDEGRHG